MTPEETARVLAKCAAFDRRTVGRADVLAWHEVLGGLDVGDALAAVTRGYATNRDWIMPSDVVSHAADIRRERVRRERHAAALEGAPATDSRPLTDRSPEIQAFVRKVRDGLPPGDPDSLRHGHRHWRQVAATRQRQARAVPNPDYNPQALARLAGMQENQPDHEREHHE